MERYIIIKNIDKIYWDINCPVQVDKFNILLDNTLQKNVLQLKLRNISDKQIMSVYADIECYDDAKDSLGRTENISYMGLRVNTGDNFGDKQPIVTEYKNIGYIDIIVTKIVFSDESVWRNENGAVLKPFDEYKSPYEYYGSLLFNQFKEECKNVRAKADYAYEDKGEYWICTCGQPNKKDNKRCCVCYAEKQNLEKLNDKAYIEEKYNDYLEKQQALKILKEKTEKERAEREAKEARQREEERIAKKKKYTKIILSVSAAAIVTAVAAVGLVFGVKYISSSKKYNEATSLLNSGSYEQAEEIYTALGNFKNSSEMITECKYQQAEYFYSLGDYVQSGAIYNELGSYKDCTEKAAKCSEGLNEYNYNRAMDLLNKNDYAGAREIFVTLGDYKDSAQRINNIDLELKYRDAVSKFDAENYKDALAVFNELKDYKEAKNYIYKCNLQFDKYNYKQAYKNYIAGIKKRTDWTDPTPGGYMVYYAYEYSLVDLDGNGVKELIIHSAIPDSDGFRTTILTYSGGDTKQLYQADDKLLELYYSYNNGKYYALYQEMVGDDYMYSISCSSSYFNLNLESRKTQDYENGYSSIMDDFPNLTPVNTYPINDLSMFN